LLLSDKRNKNKLYTKSIILGSINLLHLDLICHYLLLFRVQFIIDLFHKKLEDGSDNEQYSSHLTNYIIGFIDRQVELFVSKNDRSFNFISLERHQVLSTGSRLFLILDKPLLCLFLDYWIHGKHSGPNSVITGTNHSSHFFLLNFLYVIDFIRSWNSQGVRHFKTLVDNIFCCRNNYDILNIVLLHLEFDDISWLFAFSSRTSSFNCFIEAVGIDVIVSIVLWNSFLLIGYLKRHLIEV